MTPLWDVVADDDIAFAGETAAFLGQFCPPEADPVWSEEYFRWKLGDANPAGTGFCTLARHDGKVIGSTTITRKRIWLGDRVEIGGEIGDTYTDADYRRQGQAAVKYPGQDSETAYLNRSVFGRLVAETRARAEAAGLGLIYGTPNANSLPGYHNRLGFPEYVTQVTENFHRPTVGGIAERFSLPRASLPLLVPFDRLCSLVGDALSRIQAPGFDVAPFDGDDAEIDALWDRTKHDLPFSLVRDAQWFRYRFQAHPLNTYEMFQVRRGPDLAALLVTRTFVTMRGRPYMYIADWLAGKNEGNALKRALNAALRRVTPATIDGVLLWAEQGSDMAAQARRSGFLARGKSSLIFADTAAARELAQRAPRLEFSIAFSDNV
jgi:GNAT superfamily N-acetyltransferase